VGVPRDAPLAQLRRNGALPGQERRDLRVDDHHPVAAHHEGHSSQVVLDPRQLADELTHPELTEVVVALDPCWVDRPRVLRGHASSPSHVRLMRLPQGPEQSW
jgi:hypothetical protein